MFTAFPIHSSGPLMSIIAYYPVLSCKPNFNITPVIIRLQWLSSLCLYQTIGQSEQVLSLSRCSLCQIYFGV